MGFSFHIRKEEGGVENRVYAPGGREFKTIVDWSKYVSDFERTVMFV